MNINIKNQNFILHASGAAFWQEKEMILISDVHLGKVSHFRKFGAAVPQKAIQKNFDLMSDAVQCFSPKTICFLGDLFHSVLNKEWQLFENWVTEQSAALILVEGNHDIISPLKYEKIGVEVVSQLELDGFLLTHHPQEKVDFFNFSGHIHPAIRLRGAGRQSLRLPCFFKRKNQMIFPAFGEFTGSHTLKPTKKDEVFAISENSIFQVDYS